MHFSILLAKKGLHILVVKPMATTTTEARDMINAVNTAKVIGRWSIIKDMMNQHMSQEYN